jgi:class 3 adenylate cyclase
LRYESEFLPAVRHEVVEPPTKLRCGVARGYVYSVGDGSDFVGPCINVAARLQKLASCLTCCFSRRGFDISRHYQAPEHFVIKRTMIRGIGDNELVYVLKREFDLLPEAEKVLFSEP